jgi:hypothetical protein
VKQTSATKKGSKRNHYRRTTVALPPTLYKRIAALARTEARSLNKQLVLLLKRGLKEHELAQERSALFRHYTTKAFGGLTAEEMERLARGV